MNWSLIKLDISAFESSLPLLKLTIYSLYIKTFHSYWLRIAAGSLHWLQFSPWFSYWIVLAANPLLGAVGTLSHIFQDGHRGNLNVKHRKFSTVNRRELVRHVVYRSSGPRREWFRWEWGPPHTQGGGFKSFFRSALDKSSYYTVLSFQLY